MAMMFGRFEIQSEISKSETALIYKALDTESNQVVALKTQNLAPLGDRAAAFVETLLAEGECARQLASQNVVQLYGSGEIDGQFCAAMEYIQGNSIANMLARKEGFSIWDLLDITRQVCAALEHAATLNVVHSSLEPDKILVQWDGLVKVVGYGISNMSLIAAESGNDLGRLMPYCSPEQIRGEATDHRSNQFSLGTILYEMVVARKAFDASDPVALVGQIENEMPADPVRVNPKIHPAVSALIMKALAKDPAERYQSARELLNDLEACKENGKKSAEPKKAPASAVKVDPAARAAAAAKFVSAGSSAAEPKAPAPSSAPKYKASPSTPAQSAKPASAMPATVAARPTPAPPAMAKAAAAAAGSSSMAEPGLHASLGVESTSTADSAPNAVSGASLLEELEDISETSSRGSYSAPSPVQSAATLEKEPDSQAPTVAVDPMMAETATKRSGASFSDLDELPPLKEPVFAAPAAPEPQPAIQPALSPANAKLSRTHQIYPKQEEKPRIQPREVAEKAIKEISTIPPRLMLFSILGAVAVILVVTIALFFHVHSEDDGSTAAPKAVKSARSQQPAPAPSAAPAPKPVPPPPVIDEQPALTVRQVPKRTLKQKAASAPAPAPIIPGEAIIDSTPQGAQFQVDGKSDPSWVTPFAVIGLGPGKHIVSIGKTGYTSEMRSVDVVPGGKSSLVFHLAAVNALVVVNSTPAGAEIILDGRATGRVTPAQFAVEKGSHTVLVKKQGFLDETTTADLGPGQNFQYSPALRALGNAEDIQTVGKFHKLFGKGGESTAGMGTVSIHTQPKGAQVVINQHILDKMSPVEVMMGPGNYVIDITLTGFKPVHKVVSVEKGGKVAIDETLERE